MLPKEKYNQLFNTDKKKADAFDKIAEKYYFANFGTTSKSDIDVIMFSLYIDQILEADNSNFPAYSNYTLSKMLGITQTKVSNLKVKKELQYPYERFDWRESFLRVVENAVYEDRKIKLFIPDENLFLEIKNAIEENNGFVDIQLNKKLLQVRIEYFLDLLVSINGKTDRKKIAAEIKKQLKEKDADIEVMEKATFGQALKKQSPEIIAEIISKCVPIFGDLVKPIAKHISEKILERFC